jgi:thiamine monophosphate kinase
VVYTLPHEDGTDQVTAGYLLRDGVYAPLVGGHRTVRFDPIRRWIKAIDVDAVDALGRSLAAQGHLVARHGDAGPSGTGLFSWRWPGGHALGEDQSYCSEKVWRAIGAPPPTP